MKWEKGKGKQATSYRLQETCPGIRRDVPTFVGMTGLCRDVPTFVGMTGLRWDVPAYVGMTGLRQDVPAYVGMTGLRRDVPTYVGMTGLRRDVPTFVGMTGGDIMDPGLRRDDGGAPKIKGRAAGEARRPPLSNPTGGRHPAERSESGIPQSDTF